MVERMLKIGSETAYDALPFHHAKVLDALDWHDRLDVDTVAHRAGVAPSAAANALAALARDGWATADSTARWLLLRRADLERRQRPRTVGE